MQPGAADSERLHFINTKKSSMKKQFHYLIT